MRPEREKREYVHPMGMRQPFPTAKSRGEREAVCRQPLSPGRSSPTKTPSCLFLQAPAPPKKSVMARSTFCSKVARTAESAVRVFSVWPGQIRVRRSDGILIRSMIRPQPSICSDGLRPAALTRRHNNSKASLAAREKTRTAKSAVRATRFWVVSSTSG